jgi:hypothetical protein
MMSGLRKPGKVRPPKKIKDGNTGGKSEHPPAQGSDDDLYDTGDICAPERDRDDEQRDL